MPISLENLTDSIMASAAARFNARLSRVKETQKAIRSKKLISNDTTERIVKFLARESELDNTFGMERNIGIKNDFLHNEFLDTGVITSHSVGIIEVDQLDLTGTGFLVAPNILLTNHHVLPSKQLARMAEFRLDHEKNSIEITPSPNPNVHIFNPDELFITNEKMDYTLVAVDTDDLLPWIPLIKEQGKILVGDAVNIIQHPKGKEKKVVLHNSYLLDIEDQVDDEIYCWYSSDTEQGSSGAPVFNNRWEVIALHHKAVPKLNSNNEVIDINGKTMTKERFEKEQHLVHWIANEGIRTSRLVMSLEAINKNGITNSTVERMLQLWQSTKARKPEQKFGWE